MAKIASARRARTDERCEWIVGVGRELRGELRDHGVDLDATASGFSFETGEQLGLEFDGHRHVPSVEPACDRPARRSGLAGGGVGAGVDFGEFVDTDSRVDLGGFEAGIAEEVTGAGFAGPGVDVGADRATQPVECEGPARRADEQEPRIGVGDEVRARWPRTLRGSPDPATPTLS